MKTNKTTLAVLIAGCFGAGAAAAEETKVLSPVVVTATRTEQDSFDLPMSIDKVEKKDIQDAQLRMTLSESLSRIPGITAQNRNQMAQDPQISTRGFGARSSFGVRGIRLFVDGIPLSMPDGIGNPGNIDLNSVGGVEVLRGPFSAIYGSSSGGVIQLFTEPAPARPEVEADVLSGSFGTRRESVKAVGKQGGVDYLLNYSDYSSDGFRTNSANNKKQATVKLDTSLNEVTKLTTLINWIDQNAQDPGGLVGTGNSTTDPNAFTNPRGVFQGFLNANTRVSRNNTQVGFKLAHSFDANNSANFIVYAGQRDNKQFLYSATAITNINGVALCSNNAANTTCGRASIIDRQFYGTEVNGTHKSELQGMPFSVTAGVTYGYMKDKRIDILALGGIEQSYTIDTINRDETQTAKNFDQYLQAAISPSQRIDIHAGLRRSTVKLGFIDNITSADRPVGSNSNDSKFQDASGNLDYGKTTPIIGAVYKVTPVMNFYANYGKAFETPTLVETAFSQTNGSGPNLSLRPSTSDNFEIGTKWLIGDGARFNAAVFDITTQSEIIASQNATGRTVFGNAPGETKRRGLELSYVHELSPNLSLYAAYTLLDASFKDSFSTSTTANTTATVNAGNKIPGTYKTQVYTELAWRAPTIGFASAIEALHNSKVFVNDLNSESAPSYTIVNLRASLQQRAGSWRITEYVRIENLFEKSYIGSVRINDYAGSRYYEPAPGRNYIVGIKANYAF